MKPFLLTMLLALALALTLSPTLIHAQTTDLIVAADRSCADVRGTLGAAFDIQGDDNRDSWYWVGLYRVEDITPDRNRRGEFFMEGEPELWVSRNTITYDSHF
jgi:hypothetical protein